MAAGLVDTMETLHPHAHSHSYARQLQSMFRAKQSTESGRTRESRQQTRTSRYNEAPVVAGPWQHMAQTYAWVAEQEHVKLEKKKGSPSQWVLQQQILVSEPGEKRPTGRSAHIGGAPTAVPFSGRVWEELAYGYEAEAERWMRVQEESRRKAMERERQKTADDARRAESLRRRKEIEQRRIAEEKSRANAALYERERRERARADTATTNAWDNYESRWVYLTTSSGSLDFCDIPWPMVFPPSTLQKITPAAIVSFLFSPHHSKNQTNKERIRCAQLRWHPDRFRRMLGRVNEAHREAVETGVGVVARCLNDLMARETNVPQRRW